ncbi:hypothetical protein JP0178_08730 [Helicobacter pylori]
MAVRFGVIFITDNYTKYLNNRDIWYCENSNTHKIELIGNDSDFREVLLEFSENIPKAPNEIPQFVAWLF